MMRRAFARLVTGKRSRRAMKFRCELCRNETLPFNPWEAELTAQRRRQMAYGANRQLRQAQQARLPYRDD